MFDESPSQAWTARYGTPAPSGLSLTGRIANHRSIRHFLPEPIDDDLMASLVLAAQSASTSSHLQPVSVVSVSGGAKRREVSLACGDQFQIDGAARFLAWLVDFNRIWVNAQQCGPEPTALDIHELLVVGLVDAALMAERMACAAEAAGLGVCYIGALRNNPDRLQELLKLPTRVFPAFGLCLGWPDPAKAGPIKPRLAQSDFFFEDEYPVDLSTAEFDGRMAPFLLATGGKPDVTWTMRMARRCSEGYLSGREKNMEFLHRQGLALR